MKCIISILLSLSLANAWGLPVIKRFTTKNGLPVVFCQAMEIPMLDVLIAFQAGSAYDGPKFGLSSLTTRLLNEGKEGFKGDTIAEQLDPIGAQITNYTDQDKTVFSLRTLTNHKILTKATDLFSAMLAWPHFTEEGLSYEKNLQLMAIAYANKSPDELSIQTFFKFLYQDHPYAHPVNGDEAHVKSIDISDVKQFYSRYFVTKNATLVLVGAITDTQARALADKFAKGLKTGEKSPPIPEANPLKESFDLEVKFPISQTLVKLGQLGIKPQNNAYFPLMLGNVILGGPTLTSQLSLSLREKLGLTYGIYSTFIPLLARGPFLIGFSTKTNFTQEAAKLTREVLENFVKNGPSEEEINSAKRYLAGSFPLTIANNRNIAATLLEIAFYDFGDDFLKMYLTRINHITRHEVKQAFQQYINPNKLLQVNVGKT